MLPTTVIRPVSSCRDLCHDGVFIPTWNFVLSPPSDHYSTLLRASLHPTLLLRLLFSVSTVKDFRTIHVTARKVDVARVTGILRYDGSEGKMFAPLSPCFTNLSDRCSVSIMYPLGPKLRPVRPRFWVRDLKIWCVGAVSSLVSRHPRGGGSLGQGEEGRKGFISVTGWDVIGCPPSANSVLGGRGNETLPFLTRP